MRTPRLLRPRPPHDDRHYSDWRGPGGRRACRWCGVEVPAGRRAWCSDRCVEAYAVTDWGVQRQRVAERDRGVCTMCRTDTVALKAQVQAERRRLWEEQHGEPHPLGYVFDHHEPAIDVALRLLGEARRWPRDTSRDWWEADHIVPLAEGGAAAIENLRTLCVPCHKGETARLAGRLAAARRAAQLEEKRARWLG